MSTLKTILIAINSPLYGRNALSQGISLAKLINSQVSVAVLMHDLLGLKNWQLPLPSIRAIYEEEDRQHHEAIRLIKRMVAEQGERSAEIPIIIVTGPPVKEIIRLVKEHGVDLLVMSAHSESGLEQHRFSKLNEKIHRKLPCSVLFVKQEPTPLKQFVCLKEDKLQLCEQ